MAIRFDKVSTYYTITDHADLTLVSTTPGWTFGIKARITRNEGSGFPYLVSSNTASGSHRVLLLIGENGAINPGKWRAIIRDAVVTSDLVSDETTGGDGIWYSIFVQLDWAVGAQRLFVCPEGGVARQVAAVFQAFGDINAIDWNIGRRDDGTATSYFPGELCEFFIANGVLMTQDQMTAVGNGMTVLDLKIPLTTYHPMETPDTVLRDRVNIHHATLTAGATVFAEHPQSLIRPALWTPELSPAPAAAPAAGGSLGLLGIG
jgi:hypothetical protein